MGVPKDMKLHETMSSKMLPTLSKYTENFEMPPEKELLLPLPGDTTELLYFLIYIMKTIITLCVMLENISKSLAY